MFAPVSTLIKEIYSHTSEVGMLVVLLVLLLFSLLLFYYCSEAALAFGLDLLAYLEA